MFGFGGEKLNAAWCEEAPHGTVTADTGRPNDSVGVSLFLDVSLSAALIAAKRLICFASHFCPHYLVPFFLELQHGL
jgi:hypothetical protein